MLDILSAGMMCTYLGNPHFEKAIANAVSKTLLADKVTPELGGNCRTHEVTDTVLRFLEQEL